VYNFFNRLIAGILECHKWSYWF